MTPVCFDCSAPAHLPVVDEYGTMHGYLCVPCDRKRRLRYMGWRRRAALRLRRLFEL